MTPSTPAPRISDEERRARLSRLRSTIEKAGLGGVLVEVLKDVAFRAVPLSEYDARAMMGEIKGRAILGGVRGAKGVDKEALITLIQRLSALCAACPEIKELDLNPVLAYPDGIDILDARILLELKK